MVGVSADRCGYKTRFDVDDQVPSAPFVTVARVADFPAG